LGTIGRQLGPTQHESIMPASAAIVGGTGMVVGTPTAYQTIS
jgi:hypothetical protein